MDETISQQLQDLYNDASETYLRNKLTTESDLAVFDEITRIAAEKRDKLDRDYEAEYETRVETARQSLYDRAAQRGLHHPTPLGVATNSDDAITRRAHQMVQLAHETNRHAVREEANVAFLDLLEQAAQSRGVSSDGDASALLRAFDHRTGQDRRIPKQSQD